jgi:hypothetical protein
MAKFINYKDLDFKINSEPFYASQISVGVDASVAPVVLDDGTLLNYAPTNALVGNLNCDFYLTSSLPYFLNVTGTDERSVEIGFAGVTISEAYCKSLSFSVEPFTPVTVSAEFDWYGNFDVQSFQEQSAQARGSKAVPNYVASSHKSYLDNSNVFNSDTDVIGDIVSFSYSSSCDRPAFYNINQLNPFRVAKINKRCQVELSSDKLGDLISIDGKIASTKIYLKDFYGTLIEEFPVSGVLSNQNYNISQGQYLLASASVEQTVTEKKVLI